VKAGVINVFIAANNAKVSMSFPPACRATILFIFFLLVKDWSTHKIACRKKKPVVVNLSGSPFEFVPADYVTTGCTRPDGPTGKMLWSETTYVAGLMFCLQNACPPPLTALFWS